MAPGRPVRGRMVSNENDENTSSSRLTRAKAASLNVDELSLPAKVLQAKKTASTAASTQPVQRKRAALGDVSNVTKIDSHEGKKAAGGKAGLVSKAAQPTGVQKNTVRPPASRTALASKEANKKVEAKRSGPGAIGAQKRKVTASSSVAVKEDAGVADEPARKKPLHVLDNAIQSKPKAKAVAKKEEVAEQKTPAAAVPQAKPREREFVDNRPAAVRAMDLEDLDDPLMVAEYADEIFDYLLDLETSYMANPNYMAHQDDLEWKTRGILIDWLVEVHTRFHLVPETLFLAVNIVDRFLSEKVVQLDRLQLVGITAMFIASKYEEVMSPHVTNFRHVTDDGFTEAEILSAERFILSTLNYDLSYPNPMNFLRRISKADDYYVHTRTIGKYLMEISLLDHRFMEHRPSHVAAAAMGLARHILDRGDWDEILTHYSGYSDLEIDPVMALMVDYLARPIIHEAFFKKYASKKFFKTSILARNWAIENAHHFGITSTQKNVDQLD